MDSGSVAVVEHLDWQSVFFIGCLSLALVLDIAVFIVVVARWTQLPPRVRVLQLAASIGYALAVMVTPLFLFFSAGMNLEIFGAESMRWLVVNAAGVPVGILALTGAAALVAAVFPRTRDRLVKK